MAASGQHSGRKESSEDAFQWSSRCTWDWRPQSGLTSAADASAFAGHDTGRPAQFPTLQSSSAAYLCAAN
eukprot:8836934-Pyramimonas_sp.AAC.1